MVGVRQSPVGGCEEVRSSAVDMEAQQQVHLLELQVCIYYTHTLHIYTAHTHTYYHGQQG